MLNKLTSCIRMFYRMLKQGVLQFVLIKPMTAITSIILHHYNLYNEGVYTFYTSLLAVINNISISLSLYCLVLFYLATEEKLRPFGPFYKFLTVKAILFFSFWQGCLFQALYTFEIMTKEGANRT